MTNPLADLHRHLDGSLRPSTLAELAASRGVPVPADLGFRAGMGLDEALSRFAFTLSLLREPDAVRRIAVEICEDAAADDVTTLEIRFAPQLHGPDPEPFVDAAIAGAAGRAGIVLCGLYGEEPGVLERLVDLAADRPAVVGIDLAGGPAPGHRWRLEDYAAAFRRAATLGLGRTVHAGEGRPPGEIRVAIERLGAQRIGHGTTLLDDSSVVDLVVERGVVVEACPTSNVHTGALGRVEDHPLARWLDRGVRACVNTDNTLLSAVTAREELARVTRIPGMDDGKLAHIVAQGHAAAFTRYVQSIERPLLERLDRLGISYELHRHPPVRTVDEARRLRGDIDAAHVKNLFLRDRVPRHFLVTTLEDRRIDLKALRPVLGARGNPTFASPDRLRRVLGIAPGSVSPLAVLDDHERIVRVFLDDALRSAHRVAVHPLHNAATLVLTPDDLVRFLVATGHPPTWLGAPRPA